MSRLKERIENFNRAFDLYEKARIAYKQNEQDDIARLAIIQSFEIVVELGWKVLKDRLALAGIEVLTPNGVIKEAFSVNMLPTGQIWIDMIKDRNTSSHEYNLEKVDTILEKVGNIYFQELSRFHDSLGDLDE